ncbi:MAG: amidohydrolase family protein [Bryobacteraceae bacterium]
MGLRPLLCSTAVLVLCCSCGRSTRQGPTPDSSIYDELNHVSAIDNHAHPSKLLARGEDDVDADALPPDAVSDLALPTPMLEDSPYIPLAWAALFDYKRSGNDLQKQSEELLRRRKDALRSKGDGYPLWVLNCTDTAIMLANRVAMGRGLTSDRFKWVPFVDMFLFPLQNKSLKSRDPEHAAFFGREEALLARYLQVSGKKRLPATFDDYLTFVSHQLESWKADGAVAFKFELAYLRDLRVGNPTRESADRVYAIYSQSSEPTAEEYRILQDFVFRYIATEAGRLSLPVHIHSSLGAGSYFQDSNANPLELEGVFNDPTLRRTKFVLLHGAWPFAKEAAMLILKPNVYLDYSAFYFLTYPAEASKALRLYLEAAPQKVLYGSDASPFGKDIGWEETAWLGSHNGRLALALALTDMVRDGEITPERAKKIGHMVLYDNAHQLYGF